MLVSLMTCASFFLYVNWRFTASHAPSPIINELMSQPLLRKLDVAQPNLVRYPADSRESTEPEFGRLVPSFDPYRISYRLRLPFDQLVLQIRATPYSEDIVMLVEGSVLPPDEWLNFTCGLGESTLGIQLTTRERGRTLNSYTIALVRRRPPPPTDVDSLRVCQYYQDCDLRLDESRRCGLERLVGREEAAATWSSYWNSRQHLPLCKNGFSAEARWLVPCRSCESSNVIDSSAAEEDCAWQDARWTYPDCQHVATPRVVLQHCLADRKILFLGDSTLRGMMFDSMQQLNGSLARWEKAHDVAVYNQTNRGQTTFAFAYYPKFWRRKLPSFELTLKRLIDKVPASNMKGEDMVLVLGGVHWLSKIHMDTALKLLSEQGLHGVKVVVKTLGAGFHQRVHGVHYLPKEGLRKITVHNQQIITASLQRGFGVVDTLRMTYARFKDFTEGKCACHFHKVNKVRSGFYQIEGPINRQYTNILLQNLCS